MKKMFGVLFIVLAAVALVSCGGGGGGGTVGDGDVSSLSVVSSTSTGDFTPSITPSVDSDKNI